MKKVKVIMVSAVVTTLMLGGCGAQAQQSTDNSKVDTSKAGKPQHEKTSEPSLISVAKYEESLSPERKIEGLTHRLYKNEDLLDTWLASESYDASDSSDIARRVYIDAEIAELEHEIAAAEEAAVADDQMKYLQASDEYFNEVFAAGEKKK